MFACSPPLYAIVYANCYIMLLIALSPPTIDQQNRVKPDAHQKTWTYSPLTEPLTPVISGFKCIK